MKKGEFCPCLRSRTTQFLIQSARLLKVSPMVKYSALSLFADRFYPALLRLEDSNATKNWLLHPIGESNLQLFALVSLWVSSKIHDTRPLSVNKLKLLGDEFIKEQHYTKGDLLEAELVLMQVLQFGVGTSNIAFVLVEELLVQFKAIARVGEHVKYEACMDVMDLLYEHEETTSLLHSSPGSSCINTGCCLCYHGTSAKWEFPVLPWVKFISSCNEKVILDSVRLILEHIFGEHQRKLITEYDK